QFSTRFDVVSSGLLDVISADILQGPNADTDKYLRAELFEMTVYGPGSFMKPHQNTSHADNIVGSLVVIFLTVHAGGLITVEYDGSTWTHNSAESFSMALSTSAPVLSYYALHGTDPVHATSPLHSGYRVSLTYHLSLFDHLPSRPAAQFTTRERLLATTLRTLIEDPAFLPGAAFLHSGSRMRTPYPRPRSKRT
ncbi:hypothetical protein C8J57DRAFT_1625989, partial [Mycena rebaudengoi]